ncbi:MAG TPA: hypothetical protein VGQ33_15040, partial [Vicinamibacteria bacterium]|nr:hypothetical protein [Vicinamibacteria bacterium]
MLLIKYVLLAAGLLGLAGSAVVVLLDWRRREDVRRRLAAAEATALDPGGRAPEALPPVRWRRARREAAMSALALLYGLSIVVVPSGSAGIRVSQLWGTRPGPLYPGIHIRKPLLEDVVLYDTRDHLWPAAVGKTVPEPLAVQSK